MGDFFHNLLARASGELPTIRPSVPHFFATDRRELPANAPSAPMAPPHHPSPTPDSVALPNLAPPPSANATRFAPARASTHEVDLLPSRETIASRESTQNLVAPQDAVDLVTHREPKFDVDSPPSRETTASRESTQNLVAPQFAVDPVTRREPKFDVDSPPSRETTANREPTLNVVAPLVAAHPTTKSALAHDAEMIPTSVAMANRETARSLDSPPTAALAAAVRSPSDRTPKNRPPAHSVPADNLPADSVLVGSVPAHSDPKDGVPTHSVPADSVEPMSRRPAAAAVEPARNLISLPTTWLARGELQPARSDVGRAEEARLAAPLARPTPDALETPELDGEETLVLIPTFADAAKPRVNSTPPAPFEREASQDEIEYSIEVSIGRLEIVGQPPRPTTPRQTPPPRLEPRVSLDQYLRRRRGGAE